MKPHGDKFEDLPDHAKSPSETVGIWHLQLDSEGKKVKDIFFLRQLSPDELHRKVRNVLKVQERWGQGSSNGRIMVA